jgi:hypothetical protein
MAAALAVHLASVMGVLSGMLTVPPALATPQPQPHRTPSQRPAHPGGVVATKRPPHTRVPPPASDEAATDAPCKLMYCPINSLFHGGGEPGDAFAASHRVRVVVGIPSVDAPYGAERRALQRASWLRTLGYGVASAACRSMSRRLCARCLSATCWLGTPATTSS